MSALSGNPSYSTVRAQLRVLEQKGHLRHEEQSLRYVYLPAAARHVMQKSSLQHLVETFFDGSPEQVVATLIGRERVRVSDAKLERIARLVENARKGKRK